MHHVAVVLFWEYLGRCEISLFPGYTSLIPFWFYQLCKYIVFLKFKESISYNPDEISLDLDEDGGDDEGSLGRTDNTSPVQQPGTIRRSRLVLPPPKNSDDAEDDSENGVLSSRATALSLQEGNGSFKRSSLVLPPPKNEDADTASMSTGNDSLFFLDTDGEPNVKRRKD